MASPQSVCGDLDCLVVSGINLKDTETFGRQDPYCQLELAGQKFKTKAHTDGGRNPSWNERFRFVNVSPQYATELLVKVMNKNVMLSDTLIGEARHALARTYTINCHDLRLPLTTAKGKSAGELQLILTFKPYMTASAPSAAPVPAQAPAAPAGQGQQLFQQQQQQQHPTALAPQQAPQSSGLYPTIYQPPEV